MQDYQDLIAAAHKLAKSHLHGEQPLNEVEVSYDRNFTEDEVIEALAGCYVRAERLPVITKNRAGLYRFSER